MSGFDLLKAWSQVGERPVQKRDDVRALTRPMCVRQKRKSGMDKNDFRQTLIELVPGQCDAVPYEIFEDLFPPGVEDDGAKQSAYTFAMAHGCVIDYQPHKREVLFVKENTGL